jgi:CheY-like chemotaxis protein
LVISVSDTGIGIPPELHQEIFGDFTQVDTSATRLHGGSGLGLAITQRLVKMHNGVIWLDSTVGEGTTFSVAVPYTTTGELDVSTGTVEIPGPARPLILVVDDAEDSREIIASYLAQAGYGVAHADNGESALEASRKLHPEVMILDILMPDVDGWQVLKYLQTDPKTADIAVITASIADHQTRAVRRGAVEHIVKPVDRPKLLGAVSRAIVARTRPNVLVVDDDPAARDTFTSVLRVAGYPAFSIESVEMAIGWLQEQRVGLVLLDFQHAQDDAHRVLDFIKSHPPSAGTPALVIADKDIPDEQLGDHVKVLQKRGLAQQTLLDSIGHALEKYKT